MSDEKLRMIPVVVLTSSREERDMVASYRLGVNAYVVKPVDFHEFVNAIATLLASELKTTNVSPLFLISRPPSFVFLIRIRQCLTISAPICVSSV